MNAFTVDVEDYFHVQAFARYVDRRDWDLYPSRVVKNTHKILRMLRQHQVRGTFFVLGWVADRHPELVKDIQADGHEVGCHSYHHRLIYEMTPEEFRSDLKQATEIIGSITGQPVTSFRAPCFSIIEQSLWALDILIEEGYLYDSSIFPVHHDTYGIPDAERFPHTIQRPAGTLHEFPPSVHRLWKYNLPVSGGGYFRLYPLALTVHCLKRINKKHNQPFVFYLHPWELDPDQPRLPLPHMSPRRKQGPPQANGQANGRPQPADANSKERTAGSGHHGKNGQASRRRQPAGTADHPEAHASGSPSALPSTLSAWKSRFRHYQNLATTEPKLDRLLQKFPFAPLSEALKGQESKVEGREPQDAQAPEVKSLVLKVEA